MNFDIDKYHLKSNALFDNLSVEDLAVVKKKWNKAEYQKGDVLFKEKSYSKGIYVVRKGKVKIFQSNADGKQSLVYIYKKGDYFGHRPLLANEPHPVSAVVMINAVITFIPKETFFTILNRSSGFAKSLLHDLSKEFTVWVNKTTLFTQFGLRERIALSLLILHKIYQRDENSTKVTVITIGREDFASFVGTAKETLVRMLRKFKDEKLITSRGSKIIILKHKALMNLLESL